MNPFYAGNALNLASLFMIAGTGAAFSIKSGNLNFGGEGQVYLGGFTGALILAFLPEALPPFICVFIALIAAFTVSGLLSLTSGLLKHFKNADFLFTSFLASSAICPVISGLIAGPCRSKTDNLLATPFIPEAVRFKSILPPSSLNISFFMGAVLCVAFYFIITKTTYGKKMSIYGISPEFSKYAGYNNLQLMMSNSFISGGMHGITGCVAILGTYFTCHDGFYAGLGWSAFSAALLAKANPLLLIPSSLFLGFLTTYANRFAFMNSINFDVSSLIQSVILLLISFTVYKKGASNAD